MTIRVLQSASQTHSSQISCPILLSVFKLLLNLTHDNELSCDCVGGGGCDGCAHELVIPWWEVASTLNLAMYFSICARSVTFEEGKDAHGRVHQVRLHCS